MILLQDQLLENICCQDHKWQVCITFEDIDSVWGVCQNPNCPNKEFDNDPYQGVSNHCLEDLEELTGDKYEFPQDHKVRLEK